MPLNPALQKMESYPDPSKVEAGFKGKAVRSKVPNSGTTQSVLTGEVTATLVGNYFLPDLLLPRFQVPFPSASRRTVYNTSLSQLFSHFKSFY